MRRNNHFDSLLVRTLPWSAALALACLLVGLGNGARAQPTPPSVESQSPGDRRMADCVNNAALPAPDRAACVRAAGAEQDRARSAEAMQPSGAANARPPQQTPLAVTPTADGRATQVQQSGTRYQPEAATASPEVRTTSDGRATVVVPTDSTIRSGSGVR